jgi:hypothetical protein
MRLTLTFPYARNMHPLVDPDGLLCDHCGEAHSSQGAAIALMSADRANDEAAQPAA